MDNVTAEKLLNLVYLHAGNMNVIIFGRYILDSLINTPVKKYCSLYFRGNTNKESIVNFIDSIRMYWRVFFDTHDIIISYNEYEGFFTMDFVENGKCIMSMRVYVSSSKIKYIFSFDILCSTNANINDIKLIAPHTLDLVTILSGIYNNIIYDIRPNGEYFNQSLFKSCIDLTKKFTIESLNECGTIYNKECPICLEQFNSETFAYTDCGHAYHLSCINDMRINNILDTKCSICRNDITSVYFTENSIQDKI